MNSTMRPSRAAALLLATALVAGAAAPAWSQALTTVTPTEDTGVIVNPDQGWGLWAGAHWITGAKRTVANNTSDFVDDAPLFSWIVVDIYWSDIEKTEGAYDFKFLDQVLNYWHQRGKQAFLRVWVTDDSGWDGQALGEVVPQWLWDKGAKYHPYFSGFGQANKKEPDYADPTYDSIYLPAMSSLLRILAQRYDTRPDSPVAYWGVEGYGNWGEWHTQESHYPWPSEAFKQQRLTQIVNLYATTFSKMKIIDFLPDWDTIPPFPNFLNVQGLRAALGQRRFGMSRNGFIDGLGGPGAYDYHVMNKFFPVDPLIAEADWPYADIRTGQHGTLADHLAAFRLWHASWAHLYTDAPAYAQEIQEIPDYLNEALLPNGIGCRPVPTSVSWPSSVGVGGSLTLTAQWVNRNNGLCWKRYPLGLRLTPLAGGAPTDLIDLNFTQVGWLLGNTYPTSSQFNVPATLPAGDYEVGIAWTDATSGQPVFKLGITGGDANLYSQLGTVHVGG